MPLFKRKVVFSNSDYGLLERRLDLIEDRLRNIERLLKPDNSSLGVVEAIKRLQSDLSEIERNHERETKMITDLLERLQR